VYVLDNSAGANLEALPRGLVAVLFRPTLVEVAETTTLRLASIENMLWYVLYGLALVGLITARRNLTVFAYPILVSGGVVILAGLTQGNLGTAFRHRGQVLWALALLSAAGAELLLDRARERRASTR
jgi:hypothetical protein